MARQDERELKRAASRRCDDCLNVEKVPHVARGEDRDRSVALPLHRGAAAQQHELLDPGAENPRARQVVVQMRVSKCAAAQVTHYSISID